VAGQMEQHPIVRCVTAAMRAPDLVVVVPSRDRGDRFATGWTPPMLAFPEIEQGPPSLEGGRHLAAEALFKVDLPPGIVGIDLAVDFGMPCDGETMGRESDERVSPCSSRMPRRGVLRRPPGAPSSLR
jgi:hypothetical protein